MTHPSGHLQVKGAHGRRRYYALWRDAEGRHQRLLGLAHVKDSGRRTARGAVIWRAGDGPKPNSSYLTPRDAAQRLADILASAPREIDRAELDQRTFGQACDDWLAYVEHDRQRAVSTVADYRSVLRCYLLPEFGADTALEDITTQRIDAFRERLLTERRLSRRTVQKVMVLLHGILKRAKRRGWIDRNPAEDAERVALKRSGEFNVLSPAELEAVARAAADDQDATAFRVAAYTGLRMGELRALRWVDLDFSRRVVHVRRSLTQGVMGVPKSRRVRSVPLIDQAAAALEHLSHRTQRTRKQDLVFSNDLGLPLDGAALRKRFYLAVERAGLGNLRNKSDPLVFHDLRHTFGTLAVQAFALSDVRAYMGHESIETTMIYIHHVPKHDAAARLSAVIGAEFGTPQAV